MAAAATPSARLLLLACVLALAGHAAAQVQYAPQYTSASRPYVSLGQAVNLVFTGAGLVPSGKPVVPVLVLPPGTRCTAPVVPLHSTTFDTSTVTSAAVGVVSVRVDSLNGVQYEDPLVVCYNSVPARVHGAALGPLWVLPECRSTPTPYNELGDATRGTFSDGTPATALQRPGTGTCAWRIYGADGCKINVVLSRLSILPTCGTGTYLMLNNDPNTVSAVCNNDPKVFLFAQNSLDVTFTWQTGFTDGTGFQLDWDLECTPTPIPTPTPTPCEQSLPKWICPEDLVEEAETNKHCKMYPGCDYMTACTDEFLASRCMPIPPNHAL